MNLIDTVGMVQLQLGADESPLSSLDHGLGEKIPDHGHQNTTTTTNDNNDSNSNSGDNMQVERPTSGRIGMGMGMGMQMVNMRDTVGAGLMGTPTEGNVPLLQVIETAVTWLALGEAPPICVSFSG